MKTRLIDDANATHKVAFDRYVLALDALALARASKARPGDRAAAYRAFRAFGVARDAIDTAPADLHKARMSAALDA